MVFLAALVFGVQGLGGGVQVSGALGMNGAFMPTFACPVMGTITANPAEIFDYKGVRYFGCCAGCADKFAADPEKYIKTPSSKEYPIGYGLYDPVSRMRIKLLPNPAVANYHGVQYVFENAEDKTKFQAEPEKYVTAPDKEVLHCPVLGEDTHEPGSAPSYFDSDGMRVYLCCYGCINPSKLHIAELAQKAKPTATKAAVHIVTPADLKKEAQTFQ